MSRLLVPFFVVALFAIPQLSFAVTVAECAAQGLVRHPPTDTCRLSNECPISVCGIPGATAPGANTTGTRSIEEQNRDREAAERRDAAARAQAARDSASFRTAQTGQPVDNGCRRWAEGSAEWEALCNFAKAPGSFLLDYIGLPFIWWVLSMTAYIFFLWAEFLMWLGTTFFDFTVYFLVLHMSVFILSQDAAGITTAWRTIRDLMNIGIIAGFVIVGISTILQVQQYSANRFLARLIIAALLVNFSYFFAGAVIDASNFIATRLYESRIVNGACDIRMNLGDLSYSTQAVTFFLPPGELCSISKTFTRSMGLSSWTDLKNWAVSNTDEQNDTNMSVFFVGMLGGITLALTGFIFFSAAVLLLGRFVVLILLLITSPIGVAGVNIPFLDGYAKKWWGMLFSQSFIAPVFLLLAGVGLTIITQFKSTLLVEGSLSRNSFAGIASGNFEIAIAILPHLITFGVGVAFMYAALTIARSMSESGKEFVGIIYDGLQKNVGSIYGNLYQATAGQALKLPSAAYDATFGQAARYAGYVPIVGRMLGPALTGIGKALRQDPGGRPFGASKSNADAAKDTQEYLKSLDAFGVPLDYARHPIRSLGQLYDATLGNLYERVMVGSIKSLIKEVEGGAKLTGAKKRKLERYVQSLKDEDVDKMSVSDLKTLAPYMSAKQYKRVMERTDLNEHDRKKIQDVRWADFNAARERGDHDEAARLLRNMDKTERKILLAERDEARTDKKLLASLDAKTFDEITGDKSIYGDDNELKVIRDARAERIREDLKSTSEGVRKAAIGRITDSDAGRLTAKDITEEHLALMTPAQARRLHNGTKDPALQKMLADRFPGVLGATPSLEEEKSEEKKEEEEEEEKPKQQPKP